MDLQLLKISQGIYQLLSPFAMIFTQLLLPFVFLKTPANFKTLPFFGKAELGLEIWANDLGKAKVYYNKVKIA